MYMYMYIVPSSGHEWLNLYLPFKFILRRFNPKMTGGALRGGGGGAPPVQLGLKLLTVPILAI